MDVQRLLDRVDLRALAEQAGAEFRSGTSSRCPLHGGDNPAAFHLYENGTRWHCFTNCPKDGNDGDAISFYMLWKGVDFKTAVNDLGGDEVKGSKLQVERPSQAQPEVLAPGVVWEARANAFVAYAEEQLWSEKGEPVREYLLRERGLVGETLRAWRIGWNPRDVYDSPRAWGLGPSTSLRSAQDAGATGAGATGAEKKVWCARGVTIPLLLGGQPIFVNVRRPLKGDGLAKAIGPVSGLPEVKYAGVRGGVRRLFGVDQMRGLAGCLMVEGEFDCMLGWQELGDLCDVVTLGGASGGLRPADGVYLLRARRIVTAYDADEAGQKGRERLAALSERVTGVTPPAKDLTEAWRMQGAYGLRLWLKGVLGCC